MIKYLCLLLPFVLLSCQTAETDTDSIPTSGDATEDFTAFYQRFHSDSAFQLSRITFPLEGLPQRADSATVVDNNFRWQKADWKLQQAPPSNSEEFELAFLPLGEDMIIERLTHQQWGLAITRRFARLDDGWHLIYYAGLNKTTGGE